MFHPGYDLPAPALPEAVPQPWSELLLHWTLDPLVLTGLSLTALVYMAGTRRLWQHAGRYHGVGRPQVACFAAGWFTVVLALLSPLDWLSDFLFSAHMTQHELLMLVAAPLWVAGRPLVPALWLLSGRQRVALRDRWVGSSVARVCAALTSPFTALLVHAVCVWIWHLPSWFGAALASEPVHGLQHLMFFGSAALFWWALVHGRYGRIGYGVSVLFVFATALHTSILGALFSLAQHLWYPEQSLHAEQFGLQPLSDQELAGLIMWIPSGFILTALALGLFAAWLGELERRARRRQAS
jgi:putative membrane protein